MKFQFFLQYAEGYYPSDWALSWCWTIWQKSRSSNPGGHTYCLKGRGFRICVTAITCDCHIFCNNYSGMKSPRIARWKPMPTQLRTPSQREFKSVPLNKAFLLVAKFSPSEFPTPRAQPDFSIPSYLSLTYSKCSF